MQSHFKLFWFNIQNSFNTCYFKRLIDFFVNTTKALRTLIIDIVRIRSVFFEGYYITTYRLCYIIYFSISFSQEFTNITGQFHYDVGINKCVTASQTLIALFSRLMCYQVYQYRYNEAPRDQQIVFEIKRFRYIVVLFHIFCYY